MRGSNVQKLPRAARAERDPRLDEIQALMQQGRWSEAAAALQAFERRHPGSAEIARVRQTLQLRLSAEENWTRPQAGFRLDLSRLRDLLQVPAIRVLLVANGVLYLLLILVALLSDR